MKATISITLLFACCFLTFCPFSLGDDSPFYSIEEKHYILKKAGQDGQIERLEWEADLSTRDHFQNLPWITLLNYDRDGDGLVGVNEFYKYIDVRKKSAARPPLAGPGSETLDQRVSIPLVGDQDLGFMRTDPSDRDNGMLFRHAQVALSTKFQKRPDPVQAVKVENRRIERLNAITDRRRTAALRMAREPGGNSAKFRDLFRSRLVKYRLSRSGPAETSGRKGFAVSPHKAGSQRVRGSGSNQRRDTLQQAKIRKGSQSRDSRDKSKAGISSPSQIGRTGDLRRSREASDLKGLLPPSRNSDKRETSPPQNQHKKSNPSDKARATRKR